MPRKRTRAASAKEQADYQAPLNQICENIENRQWEEVINGMPLLEELLNHAEDDNTVTGKALDTILATLTLEQSEQSSQDLETWTHLKEMAIDILQSAIDDGMHGKRKLFPGFLAALIGILTNETYRKNMKLRSKAIKCISSLLCQTPENKRYMRSEMGIVQVLANQLVEEQDIPLQLNLLGILVRISPQRLQDLHEFAKQLFAGSLVPPFLRVAPERFVADAREFIAAVQATKPDAVFGWTLRSDSVRATSLSKVEPRMCYVDFNILNMQVTPLEKGDEILTIPYGDMVYWMLDFNSRLILVTNENKAIDIKVNGERDITRIQRTMEAAQVHQHEKSSVPLSTSSAIVHATTEPSSSFQRNGGVQKTLGDIDQSNSPRASEPKLRMSTKSAVRQTTQTPDVEGNKENIPPKASNGIIFSQDSGGRNSNSTVTQWLNSVESGRTPEPEDHVEGSARRTSRSLDAPEKGQRVMEALEAEEHPQASSAQAQSAPVTPLPGPVPEPMLRLDSGRQQFLTSFNSLGQAKRRIQDSLKYEDSLFQRLERTVDEAVESRVREEFLKIGRVIEAATSRETRH
ncbi:hypothetical protein CPB97_007419 [Podila verticillata]|nr:hypothetical protein CPB97_007419 [Podila verticillata]